MTSRVALAVLAAVLAASGCTTRKADEQGSVPSPSANASAQVKYGASYSVTTAAGTVRLAVGKPEVVRLHTASFAPDAPNDATPGPENDPLLQVLVTVDGVSGQVPSVQALTTGAVYLSYLAGGVEIDDTPPLTMYEHTKMLSDQLAVVAAGGHASGYLYFESADGSGQVAATMVGVPNARPIAIWQQ